MKPRTGSAVMRRERHRHGDRILLACPPATLSPLQGCVGLCRRHRGQNQPPAGPAWGCVWVCPRPASGRRLSGTRRSTGLGLRGVTSLPLELVATSVPLPGACQRFAPSQTLDTLGLQHAGGLAALCVPKAFALPRGLRAPDLGGHRVSPAVALGPQLFTVEEARPGRWQAPSRALG